MCFAQQEPEEHYREAVKFYLRGDFKQSLSELNKVLEVLPEFEKARKLKEVVLTEGSKSLAVIGAGELSVEIGEVAIVEASSKKEGVVPIESLARRLLALESSNEYTLEPMMY